jgi:multisubunit Na+/H+ antiporter MnhG subunit
VLSVLGLAVLEGGVLTVTGLKLLLTAAFVAVANPVSVHVLSRAAMRKGLRPWSRPA